MERKNIGTENNTPRSKNSPRINRSIFQISILLVVLLSLGYFVFGKSLYLSFKTEGFQAVFLDDGKAYFGKLSLNGKWLILSEIYYLQTTQTLQQNTALSTKTATDPNVQLVKLGNELHGPKDTMYINIDQVLFWENLREDSKILEAINSYQGK